MDKNLGILYNKLGDLLLQWVKDFDKALANLSRKLTASEDFCKRRIQKEINKFYDLIQDAVDDTYELLVENELSALTSEWEAIILDRLRIKLKEYRVACITLHDTYLSILQQIPEDMYEELNTICFNIEAEDILKIVKDYLDERKH